MKEYPDGGKEIFPRGKILIIYRGIYEGIPFPKKLAIGVMKMTGCV